MSLIGLEQARSWIDKNAPYNGEFKVYYTKLSDEQDRNKFSEITSDFVMGQKSKLKEWVEMKMIETNNAPFYSFENTGYHIRYHWNYVNGKKHGDAVSYFSTGQIRCKCTYDMGKLVGDYIEYFIDGQLQDEIFYDVSYGIDGWRRQYYQEGSDVKIKWEKQYNKGRQHGMAIFYYKDGEVRMEGQYKKDQPAGDWTYNHTHDNFETLTPYVGKVFNGQEEDGNYLLWSEEEEDWIKNRGWERMERKCDSWILIENGKIIEKVKFEDIGFDGKYTN